MGRLWRNSFLISLGALVVIAALAPPLAAKTAEPPIAVRAWYWEEARTEEIILPTGEVVTVESPNPFCPAIPGQLGAPEQSCAEGRLPIEIQQGDYETPNKMSAVNFDFSLVPAGSTVHKFTATFFEAKAGCYDNPSDTDENPNYCEETDPVNIEGKELQACAVNALFGDGEGRPYREATKYTCTDSDPVAKRKEVTHKDGSTQFAWTFDLTAFAKEWTKEFTTNTSIMLVGKAPQGYQPGDSDPSDTWRTVLVGPKAPTGLEGVVTSVDFKPGELEPPVPPTGGTTGTGTVGTTGGTPTGTGSISTGTSPTGDLSGGSVGTGGVTTPTDAGSASPPPIAAAGAEQTPGGIPGYVWLAVLAGLICWSLFRSIVLESAKGIRPDGVLSQIQRLNAAKNGGSAAVAAVTGPSAFGSFLGSMKNSAGSLLEKLKLTRKG